ncbi:2-C-methyl-D-erythritol 2,4-cyclodiphosphate synthase [Salix suchowensis]|nr:2-C-methyl-D-erythritol 2,4-cyclodiphosphate synthase [Salix suchowensis]
MFSPFPRFHERKRTRLSISAASTTAIQVDGPSASSKASKTLPFRVGHGFDLHRLEPGYPLIIGGIDVPRDRGCEAHSDGDVLLHCVVGAVLGALGLPDIGQIFPDSDPKWKGAPSSVFIKEADLQKHMTGRRPIPCWVGVKPGFSVDLGRAGVSSAIRSIPPHFLLWYA